MALIGGLYRSLDLTHAVNGHDNQDQANIGQEYGRRKIVQVHVQQNQVRELY